MSVYIVHYPGSENAELFANALRQVSERDIKLVSWKSSEVPEDAELIIVSGGSSFGDAVGPGTLASITPSAALLKKAARKEIPILGIGNGFQILTHLDLLPGCFLKSPKPEIRIKKFVTTSKEKSVFNFEQTFFEASFSAHYGRYFADKRLLDRIKEKGQISHLFSNRRGDPTSANHFDSTAGIAGVYSENKKICGILFHPEREILTSKKTSGLPGMLLGKLQAC